MIDHLWTAVRRARQIAGHAPRHASEPWMDQDPIPVGQPATRGLPEAPEEQAAVLDGPLHRLALAYSHGLRQGLGDGDHVLVVG